MNRNMEAITWALNARGITPTAFRLLIQLCSYVNSNRSDFCVWPKHHTLAEAVEISVSGVRRHLNELVASGYLTVSARTGDTGAQTSNIYEIRVRTFHKMPDGRAVNLNTPHVQSEHPPCSLLNTPPCSLLNTHEPLKEGTSEIENPPLPSVEDTPSGLFGNSLPVVHQQDLADIVFDLWRDLAKRVPGIASIDKLTDSRRKKIIARGNDGKTDGRSAEQAWRNVIAAIERSSYLCGEDPPGRGYTEPFRLTLEFVTRPDQFLRIHDGGYRANRSDHTHDADTGRRFGPAEQVGREAFARLRAAGAEQRNQGDDSSGAPADGSTGAQPRRLRSAFDQYRADGLG